MKERGIILQAWEVCALLAGTKTMARRIVKPQPDMRRALANLADCGHVSGIEMAGAVPGVDDHGLIGMTCCTNRGYKPFGYTNPNIRCPFGQPGDRLWVRETWACYQTIDHIRRPDGRSFSEVSDGMAAYRADGHNSIEDLRWHIKAMGEAEAVEIKGDKWIPSIHMPRWASRITLEITGVRVERLQEIGEADAIAEGVTVPDPGDMGGTLMPSDAYAHLWESINGAGSWGANPWVWVVSFHRVESRASLPNSPAPHQDGNGDKAGTEKTP